MADYLLKLIRLYVRRGEMKNAYDHLILNGYSSKEAKIYIKQAEHLNKMAPNNDD
jgi:hypothetical protein